MQPSIRYIVACLTGLAAGAVAYLGANPVVDETTTGFATGLTALIWTAGTVIYLSVLTRLDEAPDCSGFEAQLSAMKWGGAGGGVASLGISGTALLLMSTAAFRYVAVVGLFVFGLVLASMAVGMGTVADRFVDDGSTAESADAAEETTGSPAPTVD